MGTITEICTGKTATLTKNDMTVHSFYTVGQSIQNRTNDTFLNSGLSDSVINIIRDLIVYNCDARVEMSEDAKYIPTGSGTEVALLRFLQANDYSIQDLLSQKARQGRIETNIPFSPIRKRHVVAIKPSATDDFVRVVVKGAPEYVMPFCTQRLTENGGSEYLDSEENTRILDEEIIGKFAKKGLRTLVYAYKDIDVDEWERL
jgi:Ca2+-transporting ATPase